MSEPLTAEQFDALWQMSLETADRERPRSQQAADGVPGPSGTFGCPEQQRRLILQVPATDTPKTGKARRGTALHLALLGDLGAQLPYLLIEKELHFTFPSGRQMPVHIDILDPLEPSVTDLKTTDKVASKRKNGPDRRERAQVHIGYYAAVQAGILTSPDGLVRLKYVDCDDLDVTFTWQEPYDPQVVAEADEWWDSVYYAAEHDEVAPKEMPYTVCEDYCPWFSDCRPAMLTDLQPITDEQTAVAVRQHHEAHAHIRRWQPLYDEARQQLAGLSGQVGSLRLRSVRHGKGWRVEVDDLGAA